MDAVTDKPSQGQDFVEQVSQLLATRAAGCDDHGITGFVAIPGHRCLLDQPHVIRQNISRHVTGGVLVGTCSDHSLGTRRAC